MPRKPNPDKPVLETITTRAPAAMYSYAKAIAAVKFGTMLTMSAEMMDRFLHDEPWKKGLRFRKTQALSGRIGTGTYATGWVQVNLRLRPELVTRIKAAAEENDVSPSTFIYTALYWWTWYIYPPKSEIRRREAVARARAAGDARQGGETAEPQGSQDHDAAEPGASQEGGGASESQKPADAKGEAKRRKVRFGRPGSSPPPPPQKPAAAPPRKGSSKSRS